MKKEQREDDSKLLKACGLKVTPRRLELVALLKRAKHPLSAHDIKTQWKKGSVDMVTLYRALDALVAASVVRKIDLQHGHTDYELVTPGEHHHHLVCIGCGAIEDVEGCPAKSMQKQLLEASANFSSIQEHSFEFFGTCNTCIA